MAKLPSIHLYPGDWLRDQVSGCSLSAQGLWLRMMFLMHDSERYGYLCQNGVAIPSDVVARRCGTYLTEYGVLLAELESVGVPSRTQDGIIYCRRMVKDAGKRNQDAIRQQKLRVSRSCHARVTHSVTPNEGEDDNDSVSDFSLGVDKSYEKERGYHEHARVALHHLNEKSGRHFRETDANLSIISARLREPEVSIDGVKLMVERQCRRWLNTEQAEYLRPETLFGKSKFDGYYAAREMTVHETHNSNSKPNPRNAGIATNATEQGQRIAAAIAARNKPPVPN